jgi:hypothetical protein
MRYIEITAGDPKVHKSAAGQPGSERFAGVPASGKKANLWRYLNLRRTGWSASSLLATIRSSMEMSLSIDEPSSFRQFGRGD